jgi:hypothetical protein
LYRQHAARRQHRHQDRKQLAVIGQPVQGGIRIDDVCRTLGLPARERLVHPLHPGQTSGRLRQHRRGCVHADDPGIRPAFRQHCGDVAGAATQIVYQRRLGARDARQQVDCRAQARLREFQVLLRVPAHFPE